MYRCILTMLTAGVILVAFTALPPMLPGSTTMRLAGSAQAQKTPKTDATNLNSSRSNVNRMGGGGGGKASSGGSSGAAKTTTVKSSKSNTSDRMGGGGGGKGR